jgi:hypothetical protein
MVDNISDELWYWLKRARANGYFLTHNWPLHDILIQRGYVYFAPVYLHNPAYQQTSTLHGHIHITWKGLWALWLYEKSSYDRST